MRVPAGKARTRIARSAVVLAMLLALIQFVPVVRTNPPVTSDVTAPADVKAILRRACYDCHSNQTRWPWYSRLAPVSWWLSDHVADGRKNLNFSQWPVIDLEAQEDALQDIAKQIEKGEMPLRSYLLAHRDARLNAQARATLLRWARAGS